MTTDITLGVGATAEHNTCGSCRFFDRDSDTLYDRAYGRCRFKFPEKMVEQSTIRTLDPKQRDREYTGNEDRIKDTDRCDLYQQDGKTYIVQRRVGRLVPGS